MGARRILVATSNPHKLEEIRAVFARCAAERDSRAGLEVQLLTLEAIGAADLPEPIEDADTFEANAVIKARYYAQHSGVACMADDSGLEVDALGGEPGVRSARYSGVTGGRAEVDPANNRKLLAALGDLPTSKRTARFVCAMALVLPERPDEAVVVRGTIEGRILGPGDAGFDAADPASNFRGRGENGFGYDPLFLVPRLGMTTAELSPEEKNAISHRGDASRKMWETAFGRDD